MGVEALSLLAVMLLDVGAEVVITQLVALLELAVIWQVLLDCVVGEVDCSVVVGQRVLRRSGADVAVPVPVAL